MRLHDGVDSRCARMRLVGAVGMLHQPGPYLAWPSFAWAALDRLHRKGFIDDPKNKNTSVALTDAGVADAAAAFQQLFGLPHADE